MDNYINYLATSTPINNAVKLVQSLPVTNHLTLMYKHSSRNELIFVGTATFLTVYNLASYISERRQKLNEPPSVPYGLPLIGHTLYVFIFPKKFVEWCNKNYGEIYNISFLGKTVTVTSGLTAQETLKAEMNELSLEEATSNDLLHMDYFLSKETRKHSRTVLASTAKAAIPQSKVTSYISSIQTGLEIGVKSYLALDKPTLLDNPDVFFQNLVGYMSVPSLLGEEFANNKELIKSFAEFTNSIAANIGLWIFLPKFLHPYVLPYLKSPRNHHNVVRKHIIPIVRERRKIIEDAKEKGVDHGLENTCLNYMIEMKLDMGDGNGPTYLSDTLIIDSILNFAFAAVHTSSSNLSYCLYWITARPDIKERLLEEIERVMPGKTPITKENLKEMRFMDSLVRESLRQSVGVLSNAKKAMKDYTYSNGYQIPKGRVVQTNSRQLNFGDNFNRFTIDTMDPDKSGDKASTTPAKDFVTFGMGKHLCPGRFFAVQEIEMSLLYILKNFEVKTANGKRPEPLRSVAGIITLNSNEPLIFTPK